MPKRDFHHSLRSALPWSAFSPTHQATARLRTYGRPSASELTTLRMDPMNYPIKRKYHSDIQLLTPHPSSSTQHAPSSPTSVRHSVLPSVQYARPSFDGEWFSIGRSSISNDLALPSNNRLISRVHARLRYLADQHAFEVRCLGYNGISLQIADQTMYVRRATGIMVQINSQSCELGLNVAGSLVEIEIPKEQDTDRARYDVPLPSSPMFSAANVPSELDSDVHDVELERQTIDQITALSPLTSSACMLTPSATPKTKRVKLIVHPDSSPLHTAMTFSSSPGEREVPSATNPLRPRLLNFSQSFTSETPVDAGKILECTGKENVPPNTGVSATNLSLPSDPLYSNATLKQTPRPTTPGPIAPVNHVTTAFGAVDTSNPARLEFIVEAPLYCESRELEASPVEHAEQILEDEDEDEDEEELGPDPEFVDMILMTLATSPISPAPIASFVPFFPPKTTLDRIEVFLRDQPAISEVKRSGKDAAGRALRSTWFYEPSNDSDDLRRVRLASLQKPVSA